LGGVSLMGGIYFSKPAGAHVQKFLHGTTPGSQKLQIPIPQFCVRMTRAVLAWEAARGSDPGVLARIAQLARIREPDEPL
jgi:hypothetical protein